MHWKAQNAHSPDSLTGKVDDTVTPLGPKTRSSSSRLRAPTDDESSVDLAGQGGMSSGLKDGGASVEAPGGAVAAGGVRTPREEADADWS